MTFADKLKLFRKQSKMSQEQLGEKLGVSRQAVTKWEIGGGIPDIDNLKAISEIFGVSVDELLSNTAEIDSHKDYLFESTTEYDIDYPKHYDIKLIGANKVTVSGYDGEKILVRFASNILADLKKDLKLKIDDSKNNIDLDVNYLNNMTKAMTKEDLFISIQIPQKFIEKLEIAAYSNSVEFHSINCEEIEFDGKTENILLDEVKGKVKINCNLDMNITCKTLDGHLKINQLFASSKVTVSDKTDFAVKKGKIGNTITFEENGKQIESFAMEKSENLIEINGLKNELIISRNIK